MISCRAHREEFQVSANGYRCASICLGRLQRSDTFGWGRDRRRKGKIGESIIVWGNVGRMNGYAVQRLSIHTIFMGRLDNKRSLTAGCVPVGIAFKTIGWMFNGERMWGTVGEVGGDRNKRPATRSATKSLLSVRGDG